MDAVLKGIFRLSLGASLVVATSAWSAQEFKWTDPDTGEIIFAPAPPKPGIPYDLMENGLVIATYTGMESNQAPEPKEEEKGMSPEEKKRRSDALLLLQYKSLADIDEAMEVELGHLKYDFTLIDNTYKSLRTTLFRQIDVAANRQRAGLNVDPDARETIKSIRQRMSNNRIEREDLEVRREAIRDNYGAKKVRYQELLTQNSS